MSPHPSLYQNTPTGSIYDHSHSNSAPSLDPNAPLGRRRKEAPEGPQAGINNRKGKKKATEPSSSTQSQSHGANPLEIAYGPTVGTHTQITEDDFQVDTETGIHRPQIAAEGGGRLSPGQRDGDGEESPLQNETGQWDRQRSEDGNGDDRGSSVQYGAAQEFSRNVWGR